MKNNISEKIKSEVKDLHPLLEKIFKKMEGVKNVEYTHGTLEFGADFILSKKDELLDDIDYIGVIVKKNKISQSSHDVSRQIDECLNVDRVIRGNKTINLNEIWVITAEGISANAKVTFAKKYATAKLKFIDGSKLADLIEKYTPNYWENLPLHVSEYLASLKEKIKIIEANSSFNLANMEGYEIQQTLIKKENSAYKKSSNVVIARKSRTGIHDIIEKQGTCMIEGSMGSGKSNLLRKTALSFCDNNKYIKENTLPILTTFKELEENNEGSLKNLLSETKEKNNLSEIECKYLIMIDGLDEANLTSQQRLERINEITKEANALNNIKVILAGRKIDEKIDSEKWNSCLRTYEMAPLSIKSILTLIQNACKGVNLASRVASDLNNSNIFRMLPRTPIAAILLTKLIQENQQDIPSNLTELYSKYTELSLGRWDLNHKDRSANPKEYQPTNTIIKIIAKFFVENQLTCISIDEAKGFFKEYVEERNLGVSSETLFNRLIERCDLVTINDQKSTFSFRHRTFMEYFYAQSMSKEKMPLTENSFDLYWSTIIYFWIGLARDCPETIREITEIKPISSPLKFLKFINFGNILMAANQTKYSEITNSIRSVFLEAAKSFTEGRKGDTVETLSRLSEMQLLCFYRHIMCDSYGYDFFKTAIEASMIEIEDDTSISLEERCGALFLLNTVYLTIGGEDIFDNMIEKFGANIPLSIQLAIQHECSMARISGGELSKLHRNIKKMFSKLGAKQMLSDLYEKPIRIIKQKAINKSQQGH
ncbi:restriction endonuclease [Cellvibrio polysaccharolyticus]|uniref:Restriction endonuclease n=1 Tax=Cellvibrio polysaccharolyticus TaxID=2082724 RepID=A0A928YV93_9GAMM|nr:restriction endonuclease [Cellvibrio polysaccharolyticus]MBE8718797.1 hypothetical protein [Cellvibrio polysaccharolyticus]